MKFTKSIQWRLLLWIAFMLGLVLLALDFTAYKIYLTNRLGQIDAELKRSAAVFSAELSAPAEEQLMSAKSASQTVKPSGRSGVDSSRISLVARQLAPDVASGYYFSIWTRGTTEPFWQSTNCPPGIARPQPTGNDTGVPVHTRDGFREKFQVTESGDCILAGRKLAPVLTEARRSIVWIVLGGFMALAIGLGGSWFIITGALRPVEKISAAAAKISSGDLSQRISVKETESELGQLADVLNSTFARLEASFAQQKQFTADAAHELRTPLAALISEAQITLARERVVAEYKEALAANLDAAQQMRRLTDSLLELARLDGGQERLTRQKIDLTAVVQECVKKVIPLAAPHRLQIICDLAPVDAFADPERIGQVVTNLLTNAIHYNRDSGKIRVSTSAADHAAVLTVADTGSGISSTDLPHVFERFYRANKSRPTGGLGLGLAISKAIITAHGGTIEVTSEKNVGTAFRVRLPVSNA